MAHPTSRTTEATNDYYQGDQERIEVSLSPKRPQLSPKHSEKSTCPEERDFGVKKVQGLKSGKISCNSTKSRPKPSQQRLPEEKEPQSQHRLPGEGVPEPAVPRGHPKPSQNRLPRATRVSKAPRSVDVSLDILKGVTRGQQSTQTQRSSTQGSPVV